MTNKPTLLGRLKKRPEFLYVRDGKFAGSRTVAVQMRKSVRRETGIKIGFTATKRIGNAVVRNRAKRRLREAVNALLPLHGIDGMDYVFIARDQTPTAPYEALLRDVEKALAKLAQ